ncbi:hypothetical protein TREMEDRAFT_57045 [Tremella mesenterica DSM 1558]|uniref:uncharacterized protein n=1 Tax=Tremella mesenterica (strain ATCC 24925 / CBS 8224 / DSM 1558 / NBRC 9311 / NRRL Y-6157 / RJB 2259-6 / UBC 559-6) TaxID=578456 RepID=UPI0003F49FFF|nr:uncharacterized protein TREMEDRAFT_57045 [Tremella mesenterica DSM 1558]EIW68940.1 hypothetical protein TREMEDRAFT_57045 [Tremella mesenterica DSM 1558]
MLMRSLISSGCHQPWVRSLLNLLDVSATDQIARARRKGRPKAPAPTFHLPSSLWDRTSLPLLRPKDSQGLPMSGAPGLILFKFHVDPQVQRDNPDWAEGLYDTPPIPDSDALFPSLSEVMSSARHQHLIIRAQIAKQAADVTPLGPEEIQDVLNRTEDMDVDPDGSFELVTDGGGATEGLSTLVDLQELGPPSIGDGQIVGPSPGSSVRARKQAKRSAAELPGGAAMPVAKRLRDDETGDEGGELEVIEDVSFLGI